MGCPLVPVHRHKKALLAESFLEKLCLVSSRLSIELWLLGAANSTETLLELVDTTFGIHESGLTGEEWVSVSSYAHGDNVVLNAVNGLFGVGLSGGAGEVTLTGGHVLEDNRIVVWMNISFHFDKVG